MLRERFRSADKWNGYHVAQPRTVDSDTPSAGALERATSLLTKGLFGRATEWKDFQATGTLANPPTVIPSHLNHIQSRSLATMGAWALDVDVQRQDNLSRFNNVRHPWRLPRRLRFVDTFCRPYEGGMSRAMRHPRANGQGLLVLFTELGESPPPITLPDDEMVFRHALLQGHSWPPFRRLDPWERPRGPFMWAQPSDKGRYLIGALRLLGGLQDAAAVLLHNYWRAVFEELGGSIGDARRDQIRDALKKKVRAVTTPPTEWTSAIWDRLTALVATEAHQVRVPQRSLSFDELQKRHSKFIDREKALLADEQASDADEWLSRSARSLPGSLQQLCQRGVLFQGYEWRCDTCFHTNWNDLGALRPSLSCSICGTSEAAPVNDPWSFRLHGFMQDALREHGLLALVWCLVELEDRARHTFFYLGPHELWKPSTIERTNKPDNEADLICIVDDQVHLCEVKSSARDIEVESLVEVAIRLRPDVVTLAVMEPPSARLNSKLEELKLGLGNNGIEAQLLTLRPDRFSDVANLPSSDSRIFRMSF
jgi:hypothetical protein